MFIPASSPDACAADRYRCPDFGPEQLKKTRFCFAPKRPRLCLMPKPSLAYDVQTSTQEYIMARTASLTLQLDRGQRQDLLTERGTQLALISGQVTLHLGLVWLAEQSLAPRQPLIPETSHTLTDGGWITLSADQPSQLIILPPNSTLAAMGNRLKGWLGRIAPHTCAQPNC